MRFFILFILLSANLHAVEASDIMGFWFISRSPSPRVGVAEIAQKDEKFYANAFAYRDKRTTNPLDEKNPNPDLRHRPLSEVVLIHGLEFDGENWINGRIYNPENGKFYHLKGSLSEDKQSITWRASIDKLGVLGRNVVWQKLDDPSEYKHFQLPKERIEANIPVQN
ncbi:MAG: DUF2147 domain-containing protein [Brevinema sp.]